MSRKLEQAVLNYNVELVKKVYQCDLPLVRDYVFKNCGKGDNNEQ